MVFYIGLFSSPFLYMIVGFLYIMTCSFGFFSKKVEDPCTDEFTPNEIAITKASTSNQENMAKCVSFFHVDSDTEIEDQGLKYQNVFCTKLKMEHPPWVESIYSMSTSFYYSNRPPPILA